MVGAGLGVSAALSIPGSAIETIHRGRIAVVENWLALDDAKALRSDAAELHGRGAFSENSSTDLADDRSVLRLGPWKDADLGDAATRSRFTRRMEALRVELAAALERPRLLASVPQEISYSPGPHKGASTVNVQL